MPIPALFTSPRVSADLTKFGPDHWNTVTALLRGLFDGADADGTVLTRSAVSATGAAWSAVSALGLANVGIGIAGSAAAQLTISHDASTKGILIHHVSGQSPLRVLGPDRGDGTFYLTEVRQDGSMGLATNGPILINGASGDPVPETILGITNYMLAINSDLAVGEPTVLLAAMDSQPLIRGYSRPQTSSITGTKTFEVLATGRCTLGPNPDAKKFLVRDNVTDGIFAGFGYTGFDGGSLDIFADRAGGSIRFGTLNNDPTFTERMRILSSGTVGIGIDTPNANAILDLTSTTKAFMPPRMTTTQRDNIASPTAGMVVYNSTTGKLNVRGAAGWEAVTSA